MKRETKKRKEEKRRRKEKKKRKRIKEKREKKRKKKKEVLTMRLGRDYFAVHKARWLGCMRLYHVQKDCQ